MLKKMVKPDAKGRVTLGHLAHGVSRFLITKDKQNRLILEPYIEIPAHEKWLYDNKNALEKVQRGLQDAKAGKIMHRGDFSKHAQDLE